MMPTVQPPFHRFAHHAMSTTFEIVVAGRPETYAAQAAEALFREIDRLETLLTRHSPDSDVSQINRLAPGQVLSISVETYECLELARSLRRDTGGAFDVSIGPLVDCWRMARKAGRQPAPAALDAARKRLGLDGLEGLPAGHPDAPAGAFGVRRRPGSPNVSIDFGGIGKGFALDKLRELLTDWEIDNALLHAGTSTALAIGAGVDLGEQVAGGKGWPLGVGGQWGTPEGWHAIRLWNRALSGSGTEVKGGHIIDPRSGQPVAVRVAAWVIGSEAGRADALSTAFMIMSREAIAHYCKAHPDTWAMTVESNGAVSSWGQLPPGTRPVAAAMPPPKPR
jgi:FAD:protein FMN transferase